jgi:hypothetical protein
MATEAQMLANRSNAKRSTGPHTPAGKSASSLNNLRHGFRSQSVLLPGDDAAEYAALLDELSAHFPTRDLSELRCVREMADAEWRLRRVRLQQEIILSAKIAELAVDHPSATPALLQVLAAEALTRELAACLRYESKFERQYDRAYRTWTSYQTGKTREQTRQLDNQIKAIFTAPPPELPDEPNSAPAPTPRSAPCPCGSGEKYKRCCGKNAPAVLENMRNRVNSGEECRLVAARDAEPAA